METILYLCAGNEEMGVASFGETAFSSTKLQS